VVTLTAVDQSAGTASLRTLNQASATAAAAGNHVHTPTTPNQLNVDASAGLTDTDDETTVATGTIVVQGASEALAVSATYGSLYEIHALPWHYQTPGLISPAAVGTFTITITVERTAGTTAFSPLATIYAREVGA